MIGYMQTTGGGGFALASHPEQWLSFSRAKRAGGSIAEGTAVRAETRQTRMGRTLSALAHNNDEENRKHAHIPMAGISSTTAGDLGVCILKGVSGIV